MHLRINDVTVQKNRVDELADVLMNKALPVVVAQKGSRGLLCAADRPTGNCVIVSFWDSRKALEDSEKAIASIRSATIDAVDATLNNIVIAEVLREVTTKPTKVGSLGRAVAITAPAGSAKKMVEFYDAEAVPRLQKQKGFLNSRLIRDLDNDGQYTAVSHWADAAALQASDQLSVGLREQVAKAVPGTQVARVTTPEIILVELVK